MSGETEHTTGIARQFCKSRSEKRQRGQQKKEDFGLGTGYDIEMQHVLQLVRTILDRKQNPASQLCQSDLIGDKAQNDSRTCML